MRTNWFTTRSRMLALAMLPAIGTVLCAEVPAVHSAVRAVKGESDNRPIDETRADVDTVAGGAEACELVGGWEVIPAFR